MNSLSSEARARALYRHVIESGYRFFSYGDAMLLDRSAPPPA